MKTKKWLAVSGVVFVHLAVIALFFGGIQAVITHIKAFF